MSDALTAEFTMDFPADEDWMLDADELPRVQSLRSWLAGEPSEIPVVCSALTDYGNFLDGRAEDARAYSAEERRHARYLRDQAQRKCRKLRK